MRFFSTLMTLAASAAVASAGTVTFWTLDDVQRTIYFTPNAGLAPIQSVTVNNQKKTTVDFPDAWIGNFYAVQDGHPNVPGMLGEVTFGGWNGQTYFDVSAIVVANDNNNVKQMWPADSLFPMSGCEVFPCDNVYWHPDDVQTKVTEKSDLICSLGTGATGLSFQQQ